MAACRRPPVRSNPCRNGWCLGWEAPTASICLSRESFCGGNLELATACLRTPAKPAWKIMGFLSWRSPQIGAAGTFAGYMRRVSPESRNPAHAPEDESGATTYLPRSRSVSSPRTRTVRRSRHQVQFRQGQCNRGHRSHGRRRTLTPRHGYQTGRRSSRVVKTCPIWKGDRWDCRLRGQSQVVLACRHATGLITGSNYDLSTIRETFSTLGRHARWTRFSRAPRVTLASQTRCL